jgi:predicted nucleotidyltransferase
VQNMYRGWKARKSVREASKRVYEKLYDEESQTYYYWSVMEDHCQPQN